MPVLRPLCSLLLGLASFAAVNGLVRGALPWPEALGLRQKVEHFREVEDDYDVIYVGSSFLLRSFVTPLIDEELAGAGRPLRSYNFGVPAMTSLETDHLLRWIVGRRPARLRHVVLEPSEWFPVGPNDPSIVTQRNTGWHSWRQTRNAIGFLWREPLPLREKWEKSWGHFRLGARHWGAYGRGPELVRRETGVEHFSAADLGPGQGFQALDELESQQGRRRKFAGESALWRRRLSVLAAEPRLDELPPKEVVRERLPARFFVPATEEQVAFLRRHGIEPIYVVPPRTLPTRSARLLRRGEYLPSLLLYDDPERLPELYAREGFFDLNHLNRRGAETFSRRFAGDLADWLAARDEAH